jgi:hypothetical protein
MSHKKAEDVEMDDCTDREVVILKEKETFSAANVLLGVYGHRGLHFMSCKSVVLKLLHTSEWHGDLLKKDYLLPL